MPTQGATTKALAAALSAAGWTVVFVCLPNNIHRGVVPISTVSGSARQRYPDVLAVDAESTRLVEVENALTAPVAEDIALRFGEQKKALEDRDYWEVWRRHVEATREIQMPTDFFPILELVISGDRPQLGGDLVQRLAHAGIWTGRLADFESRLAS